jgi:hypothetical protein
MTVQYVTNKMSQCNVISVILKIPYNIISFPVLRQQEKGNARNCTFSPSFQSWRKLELSWNV